MTHREAHAVSLLERWPICEDLAALESAAWARPALDKDGLARLGCRIMLPSEIWLHTIRCGPGTPKGIRGVVMYSDIIDWKPVLPEKVCEIQAWHPGQWVKIFYTYRENLLGAWR